MILKGKANPVKKHSGKSKRAKKNANKMEEKIGKDNSQKDCQDPVCPLCMDHLDYDDINFYPCQCGYQICRFCWHRIRTEENSLCPNCRRLYSEDPATFKSVSLETIQKLRNERKQKEIQKKKEQAESRKQLANIRVVQKNLVFVHGLPQGIDHSEKYRKLQQIFKDFGPVVKCVVNNKTSYVGSQIPRASVYVTYQRIEDALRAYKSLPSKIEDYDVKTSLGTTKYCSNFLKNAHCPKQDCMYLHEQADEELCFTKDQIHNGNHLDFGDQLYEKMVNHSCSKSPQTSQQKDSGPLLIEQQQEETLSKLGSLQIQEPVPTPTSSPRPMYSSEPSSQSKLQHLFSSSRDHPSDQVNGSDGSCSSDTPRNYEEYRNKFMSQYMDPSANGDSSSIQKSLLEDNSVNTPLRTFESLHTPDKEIWPEHRNLLAIQTNNRQYHQNSGNVPEYLLNHVNSTSQALQGLQFRQDDGPFHPQRESPELEAPDDDLGFDPIGLAMSGLANILKNSQPPQTIKRDSLWNSHSSQHIVDPSEQQALQYKLQMQRLKNPPPGFPVNHVQQNQSLPSPVYNAADTSSNVLINRMSPPPPPIHQFRNSVRAGRYHQSRVVLNGNSLINRMPTISASSYLRPNFQTQRYQQQSNVAMNGIPAMNGYSSQSLRNIAPQSIPLQTPSMQEMLARSVANTQHIQSQSQNISHMPFGHVDQNLSPSLWNVNQSPVNQTQWMHPENSFPGQSMQDFRPASPSLSLSRRVHPQLRPEFTRQFPQPLARFTNPPTFTDNPQFLYPSAQHNQLTKGVHTFP